LPDGWCRSACVPIGIGVKSGFVDASLGSQPRFTPPSL